MTMLSRRGAWVAGVAVVLFQGFVARVTPFLPSFDKYGLAARQRLAGELPTERLVDFSPLYLDLSTALERWVPDPGAYLRGLQLLAVGVSALLLALWLRRRVPRGLLVGVLVVFALDRHVLVYARILEPETLLLTFTLGWLAAIDRFPGRAGVLASLGILTRPTLLPVALLGPVARRLRRGRWDRSRQMLAYGLPILVTIVFLAGRAFVATGSMTAPTMNPGTVAFEGNNPLSRGTSAVYPPSVIELLETMGGAQSDGPHVLYREVARAAEGPLDVAEVNAFWSARVRAFLLAKPVETLHRLREKLLHALHSFRWHDVEDARVLERVLHLPVIPFGLLGALAFLGLAVEVRRWKRSLLPYALAASQLAVQLVFYVSARQRILWLPAVLYFAARAIIWLWTSTRTSHRWVAIALVVSLTLTSMIPDVAIADERMRGARELEATARLVDVKLRITHASPIAHHTEEMAEALATAPWWAAGLRPAFARRDLESRIADALEARGVRRPAEVFDLARASYRAGRFERAEELLRSLGDEPPVYRKGLHSSSPGYYRALVALATGDRSSALRELGSARVATPGELWVLGMLAALGDATAGEELQAFWGPVDADLAEGRAALVLGDDARAIDLLGPWVDRLPGLRDARLDLAVALGRTGRLQESVGQTIRALRTLPEPLRHGDEIAEIFGRWAAEAPGDVRRVLPWVRMLARAGRFDEAAQALGRWREAPLEDPVLLRERDRLGLLLDLSAGS